MWPLTVLATVIVTATIIVFIIENGVSTAAIAAASIAAVASIGAWAIIAGRSRAFALYSYAKHRERTKRAGPDTATLNTNLANCGAEQAREQLGLLERKMETVRAVLLRRLDEGELTFQRYLVTAEQVYLAGLDNLHEIEVALTAQGGMDRHYLERRRQALDASSNEQNEVEKNAINERMRGHSQLDEKVRRLLAQNEAILAALDATSVNMAEAKLGSKAGSTDAETAMTELNHLAQSVSRYERED